MLRHSCCRGDVIPIVAYTAAAHSSALQLAADGAARQTTPLRSDLRSSQELNRQPSASPGRSSPAAACADEGRPSSSTTAAGLSTHHRSISGDLCAIVHPRNLVSSRSKSRSEHVPGQWRFYSSPATPLTGAQLPLHTITFLLKQPSTSSTACPGQFMNHAKRSGPLKHCHHEQCTRGFPVWCIICCAQLQQHMQVHSIPRLKQVGVTDQM